MLATSLIMQNKNQIFNTNKKTTIRPHTFLFCPNYCQCTENIAEWLFHLFKMSFSQKCLQKKSELLIWLWAFRVFCLVGVLTASSSQTIHYCIIFIDEVSFWIFVLYAVVVHFQKHADLLPSGDYQINTTLNYQSQIIKHDTTVRNQLAKLRIKTEKKGKCRPGYNDKYKQTCKDL